MLANQLNCSQGVPFPNRRQKSLPLSVRPACFQVLPFRASLHSKNSSSRRHLRGSDSGVRRNLRGALSVSALHIRASAAINTSQLLRAFSEVPREGDHGDPDRADLGHSGELDAWVQESCDPGGTGWAWRNGRTRRCKGSGEGNEPRESEGSG